MGGIYSPTNAFEFTLMAEKDSVVLRVWGKPAEC